MIPYTPLYALPPSISSNTYRWEDHDHQLEYANLSRPTPLSEPDDWFQCDWTGWDYRTSSIHAETEEMALRNIHRQSVYQRHGRIMLNHLEWRIYVAEMELRRAKVGVMDIYGEVAKQFHIGRDQVLHILDQVEIVMATREVLGLPPTPPIPLQVFEAYRKVVSKAA